jgi:DoxX-like protein
MPAFLRNNKVLWTLQILLAALYLFAGGLKLVAAPDQLRPPDGPIPSANMMVFLRMIGGFEVLGALGLILPGLTGIRRHLTSVAAGCLAFIMLGAVVTSVMMMGVQTAILPFVVGILDLVVMFGRRGWGRA